MIAPGSRIPPSRGAHWRVVAYAEVESTLDLTHRAGQAGEKEGLLVIARTQSQGRGRSGAWVSGPGNFYGSLLLRPPAGTGHLATLGLMVCCVLRDTLVGLGGDALSGIGLKWPNDLLVEGRKVAGVLIEGRHFGAGEGWVSVGMGINLSSAPEGSARWPAGDLASLTGVRLDPARLASGLVEAMRLAWPAWLHEGFAAWRVRWLACAAIRPGEGVTVRVGVPGAPGEHEEVRGRFGGLAADGALMVECGGRMRLLHLGELVGHGA